MPVPLPESGGETMTRYVPAFCLAGLLLSAGVHAASFERVLRTYPQTASALTLRSVRGDFAIGRDLLFGVDGNPRSFVSALMYLRAAAARHYAPAQTLLGVAYQNGFGVHRSRARAQDWYRRAAAQGYARAEIELGNLYAAAGPEWASRAIACYARAAARSAPGSAAFRDAVAGMRRLGRGPGAAERTPRRGGRPPGGPRCVPRTTGTARRVSAVPIGAWRE